MKINTQRQTDFFEGGKESRESSAEFRKKVNQIKQELHDKYNPVLSTAKNWLNE